MRVFMMAAAAALLAGCASVKYNGAETKAELINYPEVGKTVTAQVGDYLVRKGTMVQEQALSITSIVDRATFKIPPGIYKQVGADEKYWFYAAAGSGGIVTWNGLLSDPPRALAVAKQNANGEVCVIAGMGAKTCYPASYERKTVMAAQAQSFQQTLIYSGRVGNKINIGYREFSNDTARPAFNNDVEYDLTASHTIGYKGAEIEVIDANNSSITYRVIKPFP
ncbi:hypothetical protein [Lysobacter enzymogenes]|uniref:hypothetical protein n=1 Tax=Lysobacter enzymogenes TaxID=69 RepID=UPI00099C250A|nr:hypothetical protein [Lysobacter enzymogenes]UZW62746.1 hypothetical protein BV903_010830 [Lysobacter enzymogenes]